MRVLRTAAGHCGVPCQPMNEAWLEKRENNISQSQRWKAFSVYAAALGENMTRSFTLY